MSEAAEAAVLLVLRRVRRRLWLRLFADRLALALIAAGIALTACGLIDRLAAPVPPGVALAATVFAFVLAAAAMARPGWPGLATAARAADARLGTGALLVSALDVTGRPGPRRPATADFVLAAAAAATARTERPPLPPLGRATPWRWLLAGGLAGLGVMLLLPPTAEPPLPDTARSSAATGVLPTDAPAAAGDTPAASPLGRAIAELRLAGKAGDTAAPTPGDEHMATAAPTDGETLVAAPRHVGPARTGTPAAAAGGTAATAAALSRGAAAAPIPPPPVPPPDGALGRGAAGTGDGAGRAAGGDRTAPAPLSDAATPTHAQAIARRAGAGDGGRDEGAFAPQRPSAAMPAEAAPKLPPPPAESAEASVREHLAPPLTAYATAYFKALRGENSQ